MDKIIGNKEIPRRTRSHFRPEESALGLLSMIEPTKVDDALTDDGWILAMQDVLEQGCFTSHLLSFDNNKVLKIINWIC